MFIFALVLGFIIELRLPMNTSVRDEIAIIYFKGNATELRRHHW